MSYPAPSSVSDGCIPLLRSAIFVLGAQVRAARRQPAVPQITPTTPTTQPIAPAAPSEPRGASPRSLKSHRQPHRHSQSRRLPHPSRAAPARGSPNHTDNPADTANRASCPIRAARRQPAVPQITQTTPPTQPIAPAAPSEPRGASPRSPKSHRQPHRHSQSRQLPHPSRAAPARGPQNHTDNPTDTANRASCPIRAARRQPAVPQITPTTPPTQPIAPAAPSEPRGASPRSPKSHRRPQRHSQSHRLPHPSRAAPARGPSNHTDNPTDTANRASCPIRAARRQPAVPQITPTTPTTQPIAPAAPSEPRGASPRSLKSHRQPHRHSQSRQLPHPSRAALARGPTWAMKHPHGLLIVNAGRAAGAPLRLRAFIL